MGSRARLILLAVPLLALPGCDKPAPAQGRTQVRMLCGPDVGGFAKEIIEKFEGMNPDVDVEMVEGPAATNVREDMYATAFMGGEDAYDVVFMDVVWLPKFAAQGWLRPLDDFFPAEQQAEFLPGDIEGSRFQGKIYRVPVQADGGMLFYRKDLLAAAGLKPPETFAELASIAQRLQDPPGLWGFVFQGQQYEGLVCAFLELVWGHGGTLLDERGEVRIDEPPAVEALRWLVDAVRGRRISPEGVLTYQEEEARHAFQEGKAVFMRNWPYAWNLLQDKGSPVRGKVGILPMVRAPGGRSAATLGGWGYGISSFSKSAEAAWRFIQFATSRESQKLAYMKGGIIPTRSVLFSDPDIIRTSPHYKELHEVLKNARPRPIHPSYARISDALQLQVSAALAGQATPEEALARAARSIRRIVER